MPRLRSLLPLVALGAVLAFVGGAEAPHSTTHTVQTTDAGFAPLAPINVGDSVIWQNIGAQAHTATRTASPNPWNTGNIPAGQTSAPIVFNTAGTFEYVCTYHPNMVGTITVQTSTPAAPTVTLSDPTDGGEVPKGQYTVRGTATNADRVLVVVDGQSYEATGTSSWTWTWDTSQLQPGSTHTLKARAEHGAQAAETDVVTVTIVDPNDPPTVAITSPTAAAVVNGTVTVTGTAADDLGVQRVEFRVDDGAWSTATGTTSWSFAWDTTSVANGSRTLKARAVDTSGQLSPEATVQVTVANEVVDDDLPVVTLTWPLADAALVGNVTLWGNATDDVGVSAVHVRVDGGEWRLANGTAPWTLALDTTALPNGWKNLTARATDTRGQTNTSATVAVRVENPVPEHRLTIELDAGTVLEGVVQLRGTYLNVTNIEWRSSNGTWRAAAVEAGVWSATWDTRDLADGIHGVEARGDGPLGKVARGPVYVRVQNGEDALPGSGEEAAGETPRITSFLPTDGTNVAGAVRFLVVVAAPEADPATVTLSVDGARLHQARAPLEHVWPAFEASLGEHRALARACNTAGCVERTWSFTVVPSSVRAPSEGPADGTQPAPDAGPEDDDGDDGVVPGAEVDETTQDETPAPGWLALVVAAGALALARRRRP